MNIKLLNFISNYHLNIFFLYLVLSLYYLSLSNININSVILIISNFSLLVFTHIFSKYHDRAEDTYNKQIKINRKILYFSILFYIVSLIGYTFLYINEINLLAFFIVFSLLCLFYSFPKQYRIKRILLLKNIVPASIWFISLNLIIYINTINYSFLEIIHNNFYVFLLFLMFEIYWDLPDTYGDKKVGVGSLPAFFGFQRAKFIIYTLSLICLLLGGVNDFNVIVVLMIINGFTFFAKESWLKNKYHLAIYLLLFYYSIMLFFV